MIKVRSRGKIVCEIHYCIEVAEIPEKHSKFHVY